jgi:hypothetical protein
VIDVTLVRVAVGAVLREIRFVLRYVAIVASDIPFVPVYVLAILANVLLVVPKVALVLVDVFLVLIPVSTIVFQIFLVASNVLLIFLDVLLLRGWVRALGMQACSRQARNREGKRGSSNHFLGVHGFLS